MNHGNGTDARGKIPDQVARIFVYTSKVWEISDYEKSFRF